MALPGTAGGLVNAALSYTKPKAAEVLSISVDSFERYVMPEIKAIRRGRPVLIPAGELERWVEKTRSRCCRQVHKGRRRLALAGRSVWLPPRRRMAATTSPQGLVRSHRGWSLARGLGDTPSASDHRFPSGSVRGGPNRRHWPCGSTFRADTLRRMRRGRALSRWCAVGGVAVVAIVAVQGASGSADRASALPGRILPGVGVDHLRLGMSEQAARRALRRLGRPAITRRLPRPDDREYVELRFPRNQTQPIAYVVGTEGTRTSRKVVLISVHTWRNRTPRGVGIGDSQRKLLRTYPGIDCRKVPDPESANSDDDGLFCTLGDRSKRNTVFVLRNKAGWVDHYRPPDMRVQRIHVREPFVNLDLESHA
jgi:hypothetical protein